MFVMGDHRLVSQDSRCQGQVPIDNVIGRAFVIVWPSGRWDWLTVPATFSKVPKPYAAAPGGRSVNQPLPSGGDVGFDILVVPILASLVVPARSRRIRRVGRSRLRW